MEVTLFSQVLWALAEMGATEYQLMSVMGWTKPDMARVYIEKANRGKMASAAIHSLDKEAIQDGEDLVLLRDDKGEYGLVGR